MKQKDIALIVVIVFISAIFSLVISKFVFNTAAARQQQVEVVQPISASFTQPDPKYFTKTSFDPTMLITIGQTNNPTPFNGSTTGQ